MEPAKTRKHTSEINRMNKLLFYIGAAMIVGSMFASIYATIIGSIDFTIIFAIVVTLGFVTMVTGSID